MSSTPHFSYARNCAARICSTTIYLLTAAFFCFIFTFIADLSIRQSIVLAIVIVWLKRGLENAVVKPTMRFHPYWVAVKPRWYQLLTDYKLINSLDEWRSVHEHSAHPSVLRHGMHFTVVQQSAESERMLVYVNNRGFRSVADFNEEMKPIQTARHPTLPLSDQVWAFVRPGSEGHDLGIIVPEWWWDQIKSSCPRRKDERRARSVLGIEPVLATVSYREFDLYWKPSQWSDIFYFKTSNQIRDRREEARMRLGWKAIENFPESIEHQYFNVEHHSI